VTWPPKVLWGIQPVAEVTSRRRLRSSSSSVLLVPRLLVTERLPSLGLVLGITCQDFITDCSSSRTFKQYIKTIGSHAASFKRPLLSVDVSVCLCVGNFNNAIFQKLSDLGVCVQLGTLQENTARWLVMSLMTSPDYNVILMTSQSSKSSHLETRNRINYPRGYFIAEHVFKKSAHSV